MILKLSEIKIFLLTLFTDSHLEIKKMLNIILVIFSKKRKTKMKYLLGDFYLNFLDYDTNLKVKFYCNTAFSHNFITIINKPTRFTSHNTTIINHILTNSFYRKMNTQILKVDISDHFLIFFTYKLTDVKASQDPVFVTKRDINNFTSSK